MAHRPENSAAARRDFVRCLLLEIVAERIIGGNEKPRFATLIQHAARQGMAVGPSIVGPVNSIGRAFRTGQKGRSGSRTNYDLVAVSRNIGDGKRNGRIR